MLMCIMRTVVRTFRVHIIGVSPLPPPDLRATQASAICMKPGVVFQARDFIFVSLPTLYFPDLLAVPFSRRHEGANRPLSAHARPLHPQWALTPSFYRHVSPPSARKHTSFEQLSSFSVDSSSPKESLYRFSLLCMSSCCGHRSSFQISVRRLRSLSNRFALSE
eukprot:RCo034152